MKDLKRDRMALREWDNEDRFVNQYTGRKRLGTYLIEAHLVTAAHVEVALRDQERTGYRLGDILVLRGWVRRELIEWIVEHKLLPERQLLEDRKIAEVININIINPKDQAEIDTVILARCHEQDTGYQNSDHCDLPYDDEWQVA
jgi:hypothetical protein